MTGEPLLLELAGDQPCGERRCVQRRLQLLGEIRQSADMILVPVREDDAGEPLLPGLDELKLGQDRAELPGSWRQRKSGQGRP